MIFKENTIRRIAAIMFTDIVGYTALMQGDEEVATKIRAKHRQVFEQQHILHQGEIIQYYGDGTLSVFKSAVAAAKCAIEIQALLSQTENPTENPTDNPTENQIEVPLRIGLHMGDIVFDKTEVYGDAVNFASRIENLGIAGAILISAKLNDELKNHSSISTTSLGQFELKNVTGAVEVFAITNNGLKIPQARDLNGRQKINSKTIAVLPFINMSASKDNEFFSDGITEEIINALAKIKNLRVTSRTSSFFFKNKNIPIRQIGTELNVSTILEGSVRLSGNTIRITAQLIQAEKDFHFWSETWDRKLENIFEIQDEISLLIAEKLREHLGHFDIQEHLVQKQTDNYNAYELFLKARFEFRKWNPTDIKTAIIFYERAIQLDPRHAESILGLADCYSFLATTGFAPFEEAWAKAAALTTRGLELNDQLADGYYQLANLHFFTRSDYNGAFKATLKAVEVNPNYVEAQQYLSFLYLIVGNTDKGKEHLDIATGIDPLSQETLFFSAYFDYVTQQYDSALEKLNRCLAVNPRNIPAQSVKSYCLLKLGNYDEVLNSFDSIPEDVLVTGEKLGVTGLAYAFKKDLDMAYKCLNELISFTAKPEGLTSSTFLLLMYAVLGENDKAFEWIHNAVKSKSPLLLIHFVDPLIDPIKKDPRYDHYKKIIFPEITKVSNVVESPGKTHQYKSRLLNYINENRPYLDPDFSLKLLANKINIHPNELSSLLSESFEKNFNDFINQYRIQAFMHFALDPKNADLDTFRLAKDSGFRSKTVFNDSFRKETGLTPARYLKLQQIKSSAILPGPNSGNIQS
ncbi:adenylate/guanylate cyclase domain-containing protein [Flavitalea sp.]|nr:adenylate/guanylate cyclase domain-containing protein [Flavitalea sp.]